MSALMKFLLQHFVPLWQPETCDEAVFYPIVCPVPTRPNDS